MKSERFDLGYSAVPVPKQHVFLSVTPGFEFGPGIQRDGLTAPRMADPHGNGQVCEAAGINPVRDLDPTTDRFLQRAGTWTLYQHLKRFKEQRGDKWKIVAAISNGDLTMNLWHVAFIGQSHLEGQKQMLCGLLSQDPGREPIGRRVYRCFTKWADPAKLPKGQQQYEFLDLRFEEGPHPHVRFANEEVGKPYFDALETPSTDLAPHIEFALAAKPIVERNVELPLTYAGDRFEDVRHILNLPFVRAEGHYGGTNVDGLNFGEYQLFQNLNERRAALNGPVIIDLSLHDNQVRVSWDDLRAALRDKHFDLVTESPTRRGQYRLYPGDARRSRVEIFFHHNLYPFGALGVRDVRDPSRPEEKAREVVTLSARGYSSQIGNTLQSVSRMMFDFLGCSDAMVLDEGFDVGTIVNPAGQYENDELLARVLTLTTELFAAEEGLWQKTGKPIGRAEYDAGPRHYPLNRALLEELDRDRPEEPPDAAPIVLVRPGRPQVRSMMIVAEPC